MSALQSGEASEVQDKFSLVSAQTRDVPMLSSGNPGSNTVLQSHGPRDGLQQWHGWYFTMAWLATLSRLGLSTFVSQVPSLFIMLKLLYFSFSSICPPHM